jgi:UMP-CMP kinase
MQCEKIVAIYPDWIHLSAGDLLRAERQKTGSKLAEVINSCILTGKIVPSEITVQLLKTAMEENNKECTKFVIDGFPRSEENRSAWEAIIGPSCTVEFVLYFDCPEDVMTQRLVSF